MPANRRSGFTLLEMLAVITIIAILIAVAFPAYNAVINSARKAGVRTDIASLEGAIAEFESKYNMAPPSYIDFTRTMSGDLKPGTKAILRKMFPQIDMTKVPASLDYEMSGPQALVFFLGGVVPGNDPDLDGDGKVDNPPTGFSKNPAEPFVDPAPGQSNRIGPFFDFKTDRLVFDTATNRLVGYRDTYPGQSTSYWYITSDRYSAQEAANAAASTADTIRPVYRESPSKFFKPNSYQLISPGADGRYGFGGVINVEAKTVKDNLPTGHALKGKSEGDGDNMTNFLGGTLY
jgi:prepilin-type N-terminal cleavage/methylation domain-containing protein